MRPVVRTATSTAGLVAVLFVTAACGEDPEPLAKRPAPAAATTPAGAGGAAEICREVRQLNDSSSAKLTTTLRSAMAAAMTAGSEAESAEAMEKVTESMQAEAGRWIDGLRQQSRAATDPALRKAVADLATELEPVRTGEASLDRMNETVRKSETTLASVCDGAPEPTSAVDPASAPAGGVGQGAACPAPVSFRTAKGWKPEAVSEDLLNTAGATLLCEVDAKPAGVIGFIRVWGVAGAGYQAALREALDATGKFAATRYRKTSAGGRAALEVAYTSSGVPGRAFAVRTGRGRYVVVNWKGMDAQEHRAGLPAYNLARRSVTVP